MWLYINRFKNERNESYRFFKRKKIIEEYYKENNFNNNLPLNIDNYVKIFKERNKTIGIFQNFYELVELRNKLENIIDKIICNKKVIIKKYLD